MMRQVVGWGRHWAEHRPTARRSRTLDLDVEMWLSQSSSQLELPWTHCFPAHQSAAPTWRAGWARVSSSLRGLRTDCGVQCPGGQNQAETCVCVCVCF